MSSNSTKNRTRTVRGRQTAAKRQPDDAPIAAEKGKGGRLGGPAELTAEQREAFMRSSATPGTPRCVSAGVIGIDPSTLCRWLARAKRSAKGQAAADEPYRQFRTDMLKAEAGAEAGSLEIIARAGRPRVGRKVVEKIVGQNVIERTTTVEEVNGDWKALAWILERRYPKKYGRRDHVTHAGDAAMPVVFEMDTGGNPALRRQRSTDDDSDD